MSSNRMLEDVTEKDRHKILAGENAYVAGMEAEDCPYKRHNANRIPWMFGWFNARTRERLRHVFEKHGIDW